MARNLTRSSRGLAGVLGLFEDAAVELHPGVVPAVEQLLFLCRSGHRVRPVRRVGKSTAFLAESGT